ncbi:MAG: nucleotide exchange factor GrpE [Pseudanabaenaceae cyanobacterium bins.39]|nr:nucleotide exchange factor GrpE [Pseudanabaenaceae cyanobacterium bins.39]
MDLTSNLRQLMKVVAIPSFKVLGDRSQTSRRAIDRLRQGQGQQLRYVDLINIAAVLGISTEDLINQFIHQPINLSLNPSDQLMEVESKVKEWSDRQDVDSVLRECQRLQSQLEQQAQELRSQFIRDAVQRLESLLLQMPSAVYAAQQNPQLPAKNILPLLRSLDLLLQQWGVQMIAQVGMEVPFDPCLHELMEVDPSVREGSPVVVRYVGYMMDGKLLHRARVVSK